MINLLDVYDSVSLQRIAHVTIYPRAYGYSDNLALSWFKNKDIIWSSDDRILDIFAALKDSKDSYILITGAGDLPANEWLFSLKPKCIKKWFATNTDYDHPDLISLPYGINHNRAPYRCPITNFDTAEKVFSFTHPVENKITDHVYTNFSTGTCISHRSKVKEILYRKNLVQTLRINHFTDLNDQDPVRTTWDNYITDLKKYLFVASPRGNGLQCYRTWEILLVGSIPIVDSHFTYGLCCKNLPIIQVDNWEHITPEFLEPWADLYKSSCLFKNTEELSLKYWEQKILHERSLL
jgi:hypothetical protein